MTISWKHSKIHESDLRNLAERIAFVLRPGDVLALRGDLGSGKTTFARALLRVLLGNPDAEVPSPTFSLVQSYESPRFQVAHFDLYRLDSARDATELGLEEALTRGVALIEWPERAAGLLPTDRLDVEFREDPAAAEKRDIVLQGHGAWGKRLERLKVIDAFLQDSSWGASRLLYIQGDASARRYGRVARGPEGPNSAILMDAPRQPDGPPIRDGKPYSRIAHLAEDVGPYVAVAQTLREAGLSAPALYAVQKDQGLLLAEDLGDDAFGLAIKSGADQGELWSAAVDALLHLRRANPPTTVTRERGSYRLPRYDRGALQIEVELLVDWYWPALTGNPPPAEARAEFLTLWNAVLDKVLAMPTGWVLRDFHSPNLMWLPGRAGVRRVGILDFQDAVEGHPAYDLVSLLQDARVDVPAGLAEKLFARYCREAAAADPGFDEEDFAFAYAALGAQRATKILGIFTRLSRRDGKSQYLQHIPRLWGYLEHNLRHVILRPLQAWYDAHLPHSLRAPPSGG